MLPVQNATDKVYLLIYTELWTSGEYDAFEIVGVFATLEKLKEQLILEADKRNLDLNANGTGAEYGEGIVYRLYSKTMELIK